MNLCGDVFVTLTLPPIPCPQLSPDYCGDFQKIPSLQQLHIILKWIEQLLYYKCKSHPWQWPPKCNAQTILFILELFQQSCNFLFLFYLFELTDLLCILYTVCAYTYLGFLVNYQWIESSPRFLKTKLFTNINYLYILSLAQCMKDTAEPQLLQTHLN